MEAIRTLAADRWLITHTENSSAFTDEALRDIDVVVFLNTTGDVLDTSQQDALASLLRRGGGWVGIHAAADTEYEWPFYGSLLGGAWFRSHPRIQPANIRLEDPSHPTLSHVPAVWNHVDEWYNFAKSPRGEVHVLASLDETSYEGGTMPEDHPIVWTVPVGGGAAFYTGLGHTSESWADPAFLKHVAEAIDWAADDGWVDLDCDSGWRNTNGWSRASEVVMDGRSLTETPGTGVLTNSNGGGDLYSASEFGDCEIHIEFMVAEGGNSGVYLQGCYEIQILDSAGKTSPRPSDCGGIYQRWDESRTPKGFEGSAPRVNAAQPAGVWQFYDIVFRSPRFDGEGRKSANARVERVTHNGTIIHEDVELTGPTRGGFATESAQGPIRLQGDHGPIAYRNLRVRRISPARSVGTIAP